MATKHSASPERRVNDLNRSKLERRSDERTKLRALMLRTGQFESGKCWIWLATPNSNGYGRIEVSGVSIPAHRFAYELLVGPIPAGLFACHTCDNPLCVNPEHIFLGTVADNAQDMIRKGRAGWQRARNHNGN